MDPEKLARLKINRQATASTTPTVRRKWWKYILIGMVSFLLAYGFYLIYSEGYLSPAISVQVASVTSIYPSQVLTEFSASGYVVAQRRASVASKGTGRLVYLGVGEGSHVKGGEVIARLENDDLIAEKDQTQAQLNAARAELGQAKSELETAQKNWARYKNLWNERVISLSNYDTAKDRFDKAQSAVSAEEAKIKSLEAALARAAILLDYTFIRAPFDGVILTKDAEVGEVVAPFGSSVHAKAAVVTMADMSSLMVHADVAEASLAKVYTEQPCEIQLDALPNERFSGQVDTIVPTADRTRGTVMVKVRFDNLDSRILPEMSSRVSFLSRPVSRDEHPFLAVHKDVLVKRNGHEGVFRIENGRAEWVSFSKVVLAGDYVNVDSTLKPGDQVVLKPPSKLDVGGKVKAAE